MKYGGFLSRLPQKDSYAFCSKCELVFRDDIPVSGSIKCPHCGLAVVRGLDEKQAKEKLDNEYKDFLRNE